MIKTKLLLLSVMAITPQMSCALNQENVDVAVQRAGQAQDLYYKYKDPVKNVLNNLKNVPMDERLKKIMKSKDRLGSLLQFLEETPLDQKKDAIEEILLAIITEREQASCARNFGNRLAKLSRKDPLSDHGKMVW